MPYDGIIEVTVIAWNVSCWNKITTHLGEGAKSYLSRAELLILVQSFILKVPVYIPLLDPYKYNLYNTGSLILAPIAHTGLPTLHAFNQQHFSSSQLLLFFLQLPKMRPPFLCTFTLFDINLGILKGLYYYSEILFLSYLAAI